MALRWLYLSHLSNCLIIQTLYILQKGDLLAINYLEENCTEIPRSRLILFVHLAMLSYCSGSVHRISRLTRDKLKLFCNGF